MVGAFWSTAHQSAKNAIQVKFECCGYYSPEIEYQELDLNEMCPEFKDTPCEPGLIGQTWKIQDSHSQPIFSSKCMKTIGPVVISTCVTAWLQ